METKKTNIGVTYGLISGLASVVFTLMLYLAGAKWFTNPVAYCAYIIPIIVAILAGLKQKKHEGGYLELGQALKTVYTTFVISSVISNLFNYILLNYIDVPFSQALTQQIAEKSQEWMTRFKVPQEQIDKAVEEILKSNNFSLGKQFLNTAIACIGWFIASFIIAAIIKKKKPEFPAPQV